MLRAAALWTTVLSMTALGLPCPALAQGRSGPYAHIMEPMTGGTSPVTGSFSVLSPTIAPFDPTDPRTGVPLAVAYGPSPLFLFDELLVDPSTYLPVAVLELIAGTIGAAFSAWAFSDSLGREADSDIAFASIATAHALSWNLELIIRSMLRLGLHRRDGPTFDSYMPMIVAFPVRGGAGIAPRWEW